jgi:hypothetical protein
MLASLLALALGSPICATEAKPESPPAPAPNSSRLLADLRGNQPDLQPEGSWGGKLVGTPSGLVVEGGKGADGKGGMSKVIEPAVDLSPDSYIEVALGVGGLNEVSEITLGFTDVNEIQYTARLRVDDLVPNQPVWLRIKRSDFQLNDWQGTKSGQTIDWTRIHRWHLQGDWATAAPFHIVFIALRARP